ncbi:hypothetical protein ATY75_32140 [Rhizobium sp. N122]|uniref:hypothetical protein n=1 Tax=Rhizobium sp. N122 TaxID=1764272 RepID=UPI000B5A3F2A|nr:hypothetical protein [Rhizobium sp. N122]OWV64891.1 hypothetical protein ATY75_32140 [Rhizobium sp. N122]
MTGKLATYIIVAAVLVIAALGLGVLGIHEIRSMVDQAVQLKADERDAYWSGKIEKANAETNKRAADQAAAVVKIQADLTDKSRSDQEALAELRVKNAQLPKGDSRGGDCGLSGGRVGLLPD